MYTCTLSVHISNQSNSLQRPRQRQAELFEAANNVHQRHCEAHHLHRTHHPQRNHGTSRKTNPYHPQIHNINIATCISD